MSSSNFYEENKHEPKCHGSTAFAGTILKIEEVVSFSIGWMVANVEEAIGLLLLLLLGRRKVAVNRQTKNTL